tara:strand:- start:11882 stop:12202 length:321 start_codon:yes stop_codon:yes gene_type:complete
MKGALLAFLPPLLAAADAIPGFQWGTISATGLLGWYLWYTTKVVFPHQRREVSDMQEKYVEQLVSQRTHYEGLLEDLQSRHDGRHQQIVDTLDRISQCLETKKRNR